MLASLSSSATADSFASSAISASAAFAFFAVAFASFAAAFTSFTAALAAASSSASAASSASATISSASFSADSWICSSLTAEIMSAAVADYEPKNPALNKIKKQDQEISIQLKKTPDILKALAKSKKKQIVIGFALETENGIENAYEKMKRKNLDAIVLNSLSDVGAGFGHNTNKITLITPSEEREFELKTKDLVAIDILNFVEECI